MSKPNGSHPDIIKHFEFKRFGYLDFSDDLASILEKDNYSAYIKILFIRRGGKAVIDFKEYDLKSDAIFFVNVGQFFHFDQCCEGTMIFYNRDFYCVEIHDKEVACDGILFHNIYEIPVIELEQEPSDDFQKILLEMKDELHKEDTAMEEMLRILLKQIIIKSTRLWKQGHQIITEEARQEVEFSRRFSQLIEWHYTKYHTVAEYAEVLKINPKVLNKRISRYSKVSPNELIKNRIILEAKRLLVHTQLSVKEISYKLGYEDTSYFIRLFTKQVKTPPQQFRLQYQA